MPGSSASGLAGSLEVSSPQYARMIPGGSLQLRSTPTFLARKPAHRAEGEKTERHPHALSHALARLLLPRPGTDPFSLYRSVLADLMVIGAICSLLTWISSAWGLPPDHIPFYAVMVTLFCFSEGVYKDVHSALPLAPILARSTLFATALAFVAAQDTTPPLGALLTWLTTFTGLWLWGQLRCYAWRRGARDARSRNVLIVGGGPFARSLARSLRADPLHATIVRGFVDDQLPQSPGALGGIEDLDWLARGEFIDEVILALPDQPVLARKAAEIALQNHLDIRAVPGLPPGSWPDAGVEKIGGVPLLTLHREPVPGTALFLKRAMDVAGALLGLVLAAPLMALLAVLIRLDSSGPVFYSAERTGAKGRCFRCHKFRSMVSDADRLKDNLRDRNQREGPIFKIDHDPRITRVGRYLRRYSLDELPQLWNVLRGEMSLVGPRPHPVDEVNHYELHHYRRLDVKPGITGLWQITARSCPSFELNMHLDLTYIENWNLRLDLRIILSTLRVLFRPEGA